MAAVDERADGSYWERACHFFRSTGAAGTPGSYFLHDRNGATVTIGVDRRTAVSVDRGAVRHTADGRTTVSVLHPDDHVLGRVERLLRDDAPYFLLVSPDLHRRAVDVDVPLVHVVQPAVEFVFSPDRVDGAVGHAVDPAAAELGRSMLRNAAKDLPPPRPAAPGPMRPFAELVGGWVPDEEDDGFLARLTDAVRRLQEHPDGKMTLTRAYERRVAGAPDPFELYVLHARANGDYACSHYACVREGVHSIGTTPENVLEVDEGVLTVDVVAATCRSGTSDEYLARELYDNPKQLKEHRSSLANRQARFRPFCVDGSLRVVQDMQVKTLRNVCHLHSVFAGELRPGVTVLDLVETVFPLLGARPRELLAVADPERVPHRYYGGIVGRARGGSGACFLNIRNALLVGDVVHAKVGVGVLAESDPVGELWETRDKLSGLLEAIDLWVPAGRSAGASRGGRGTG